MAENMPQKIINVDDHEPARYAKTRVLSRAGFTVHDAANGKEALDLLEQQNPDLYLLDVNLPDMNGVDVCHQIKTASGGSVIVIQISASSIGAPQAAIALERGADAYLTEPVDPIVLVATVKALLRLRQAERELASANESLKTLNEELQRSNEDLEQFAYAASHDLQEPLRTVSSFASLLERTAASRLSENEIEFLNHITAGSRRMRALIDDLLTYSQVGHKTASRKAVDLNAVLSWALENLRERIAESKAQITSELLPCVNGDENQLGHLFQNLLGNAIKYARPGVTPTVHLNSVEHEGKYLVRVQDNGIGIDNEYLQAIFAPFKRLHGKEIPGTGIGLAVCRRVIEAHGGKIWAESQPGLGTGFCFTVPITSPCAATNAE